MYIGIWVSKGLSRVVSGGLNHIQEWRLTRKFKGCKNIGASGPILTRTAMRTAMTVRFCRQSVGPRSNKPTAASYFAQIGAAR